MTPDERESKRKKSAIYYQTVYKARQKYRYHNDPEYRERIKRYSRSFYDHPARIQRGKQLRKAAYWRDPERARAASLRNYYAQHQKGLAIRSAYRAKNRHKIRLSAITNSLLLTDRYIREQLSKYSTKSMKEWTADEIKEKRKQIEHSRGKRITNERARTIRDLYNSDIRQSIDTLSLKFNICRSNISLIINNITHYDPRYTLNRKPHSLKKASQFLKMIDAASKISKLAI